MGRLALSDQTNIRGLDPVVWREIRAEAVRRDVTIGAFVSSILREWLRAQRKSDVRRLDVDAEPEREMVPA